MQDSNPYLTPYERGYSAGMAYRTDAKGQGVPCGSGFIAPGKKCKKQGSPEDFKKQRGEYMNWKRENKAKYKKLNQEREAAAAVEAERKSKRQAAAKKGVETRKKNKARKEFESAPVLELIEDLPY